MADVDKEWQEFMDTARADYADDDKPPKSNQDDLDDDELEDDDLEGDEDDDEEEKPPKKSTKKPGSKEADDDDSEDDDSDEDDDDDDDEEGEDEEEDDKKSKTTSENYKPRLKQFFDKDGKPSIEKLEKGYIDSSKEAVKLKQERDAEHDARVESDGNFTKLAAAIKKHDPKLAEKIFNGDDLKELEEKQKKEQAEKNRDPFARDYEAKMRKQAVKEMDDFIENNPEAATDPDRAQKINKFLARYNRDYKEDNDGEIPSMKEALEAAYRYYGWELNTGKPGSTMNKKERVANRAKKSAANRKSGGGKKVAKKSEVSKLEAHFAKKLGVKL